jgi:hypothetical protein
MEERELKLLREKAAIQRRLLEIEDEAHKARTDAMRRRLMETESLLATVQAEGERDVAKLYRTMAEPPVREIELDRA